MLVVNKRKRFMIAAGLALGMFSVTTSALPVRAQQPTVAAKAKAFAIKHHKLMGVAAAVATHHALKVSAARAKAQGKKLNWAQRHPTLTAIGAGVATNHVLKKAGQPK